MVIEMTTYHEWDRVYPRPHGEGADSVSRELCRSAQGFLSEELDHDSIEALNGRNGSMRKGFLCSLAALLFVLAGCSSIKYQPYGQWGQLTGGYEDTQLGESVFEVTYHGVPNIRAQTVQDWALLRAADLTLDNGFRYFRITEKRSSESVHSVTTPGSVQSTGQDEFGYTQYVTTPGVTQTYSVPTTSLTIACFKEKPDESSDLFDALFVRRSIVEKYKHR